MKWFSIAGYLLLGGMLATSNCFADSDQDVAREAVRAGEILPLNEIMKVVQRDFPGKLLEVELERKGPLWVYDIKLLQNDGVVRKMRYNAKTAVLLGSKIKPAGKARNDLSASEAGEGS
ncbi:PepSY domain-containing protein [Chromobacterium alticapitis]|uniref:PepSY domain-containing protein n=1 Tax=Chromobacterium alticapitis TaxID=2073169 RepID=A0A2S5DEJ2_9NEIS|nr:PepSY domain-containing protein [Chromobacterium alticapitis]POZ61421.1 hypothetical protein C2I19_13845 [Chromobacterium alticapitis]